MSTVEGPVRGRVVRHAWSVICWIVLSGLVAGILAALYYYHRADEELRRFVEVKLNEAYPQLNVRVGTAQFIQGEGIQLGQLALARPHSGQVKTRSEIAYAETILLRCDASVAAILQGRIEIRHVILRGVSVHAQRNPNGDWSLDDLIPRKLPPCRGAHLPQITLENATVHLRDSTDAVGRDFDLEDLQLRIRLKRLSAPGAADELPEVLMAIEGSARTSLCRHIELEGVARTTDGAWTLQGRIDDFTWSAESGRRLPSFVAPLLERLGPLRGNAECQFQIGSKSRQSRIEYTVRGRFYDGSWQDPEWPQIVTDLKFQFEASSQGYSIDQLSARVGDAQISGGVHLQGPTLQQPFSVQAQFAHFPITRPLMACLPAAAQATWEKFQALGTISGEVDVQFDGQQWQYNTTIECHDVAITHYKFPYPVTGCQGQLSLRDQTLRFDLAGSAGGTPVTMRGAIDQPGPNFTGWWEATTTNWKKIDDELLAALPAKLGQFVRSLQPRGNVGVWMRQVRESSATSTPAQVVVDVDQGWINYERFPYPISNVRGRIESRDGVWTFKNLTGTNDNCRIQCQGKWVLADPDQPLELEFLADKLQLDTEFKQALSPPLQSTWNQLRPQGQLDHVEMRFFKTVKLQRPEIRVEIRHFERDAQGNRTEDLQLQPTWFPLRLSRVHGTATFQDDTIQLRSVSAEHGPIRLQSNGNFELLPAGGWQANLTELAVDHLDIRESVLDALPPRLAKGLRQLSLSGTFALAGAIQFARASTHDDVSSSWHLGLEADQASLQCGLPLESIFGQVELDGGSQGDRFWTRGELTLDSIVTQRVQLTRVTGPLWVDNTRAVFGQRVPPLIADQASPPVLGSAYQGKLSSNAEVLLEGDRDFSLQLNLTNADVATLARDWKLGQGNVAGRAMLELFLTGNARGRETLKGNGTAQLRDANLYELPLILALLGRLGSGRTAQAAFTTSDLAFHVRDGYAYFDRFDLSGDAITLKGIGEMGLSNREIDLDFYSIIGREQFWSPLVRPFLGEASRQFLQIHVDGTLSDPRTTQEVLPGLNETLQQLFPESVPAAPDRNSPAASAARPRRGLPGLR